MRDAADALHVAQSALSRSIQGIEQEFGVALLERHSRGVMLTAAGEIFLRYARDELTQIQHLRSELEALTGLRRGKVRIHAVESLARSLLPRLIGAYWAAHPGVAFDIKTDSSDHIGKAVGDAETDIGLTYNSLLAPDVELRVQLREPLVALVAARHPLARAKVITLRDAAAYPVALTTKASRSRFLIEEACRKAGVSLSPVLESNSIELLTSIIERGHALSFLLRLSAVDRIEAGAIVAVPVRSELMNRGTIDVLTRASRKLAPAGEEFVAFLDKELRSYRGGPKG